MKVYQKGFTLIEVMLVVGILALLAAFSLAQYQSYILRAQMTRAYGELNNLRASVEVCESDGNVDGTCTLDNITSDMLIADPVVSFEPSSITAQFGSNSHIMLHGGTISLTRGEKGGWTCEISVPSDVSQRLIPKACQ